LKLNIEAPHPSRGYSFNGKGDFPPSIIKSIQSSNVETKENLVGIKGSMHGSYLHESFWGRRSLLKTIEKVEFAQSRPLDKNPGVTRNEGVGKFKEND
jgi:hypothetical protein